MSPIRLSQEKNIPERDSASLVTIVLSSTRVDRLGIGARDPYGR